MSVRAGTRDTSRRFAALLSGIADASKRATLRVWHDVSIAIRRDAAIVKTGSDPGFDAFKNLESIKPSDVGKLVESGASALFKAAFDITGVLFKPVIDALLSVHKDTLDPLKDVKPGDEIASADKLLGEAVGAGVAAHFAAVSAETLYPFKQLGLPQMAALMAELAGFKEVMAGIIEPEMKALVATPHTYSTNARARSILPGLQNALGLYSRRILTDDTADPLIGFNGLSRDYVAAMKQGSFRPVQPRALATMYIDVPFPHDTVKELLEFAGYRDNDITTMLAAFEFNSVKNVRGEYLAAVTRAAEMGTIDDPTLDGHLDSLSFSDQAKNYVHLTVSVKRLEQLAELYRKSVTALYETNQLDDSQYVPALQAIGINDADANAHFAIDSARKKGRELLKEERDIAREQGKITALAVQTARTEYFAGTLDDIGFSAAITASGLPLDLIPGTIALGTAQKSARRVEKYGVLLDRTHAEVLTEKVAALKEQVVKKLTPIDAASQTLDSFGIPPANRNALLSDWSAQALKTVLPV